MRPSFGHYTNVPDIVGMRYSNKRSISNIKINQNHRQYDVGHFRPMNRYESENRRSFDYKNMSETMI